MGLLTTVDDARKSLENIFKNNIDMKMLYYQYIKSDEIDILEALIESCTGKRSRRIIR